MADCQGFGVDTVSGKEPFNPAGENTVGNGNDGASRKPIASRSVMKWLLVSMFSLVVADGIITKFLIDNGYADEYNPVLSGIVGTASFIPVKIAGALIAALLLWDIYKRHPNLAATGSICMVCLYCGIVYWNVISYALAFW